jgi:hydrogenase nickel incorporation protein HypB
MFRAADAVVLTKIDILPYVDFDADQFIANARKVHPGIEVLRLSSVTGEGLDQWFAWLDRARLAAA